MLTVVALPGSLRRNSYNRTLLVAAERLTPPALTIEIASIEGIPLYDADFEQSNGIPAAVQSLKDRIASADGLLLATPEYNASLPGVFKNAIDWLTRPPADIPRVFGGRPVAIIGASAGGFATIMSQAAWLPVFRALRARVYFGPPIRIPRAGSAFSESGDLSDPAHAAQLREFLSGFAEFIGQ